MFKKYFSGLTPNSFLLAFASLFSDISTEMLYPILPIFLTDVLNSPASVVGVIEGIAVSMQYVIQGLSGYLSDKLQRRKPIAVVGYILAAISKPLIGLSVTWPQVLEARFMDRMGAGIRTAPRDALIAGSTDQKNRGKAFGLEGFGDNLGAVIGPLIAVLLFFIFNLNIRSIFYLTIIPGLLAALLIFFVKEHHVAAQAKAKLDLSFRRFPTGYWKYLLATAIFGIGNSSNAFLILRTKQIGVPLLMTILIYAGFNLVAAMISYPAGSLSDKFGRKNILLLSFFIFILTYLGFALSFNIFLIGFLFLLYGLFSGIFRSVGKTLAVDFVPQELRASAVGWYATVVGLSTLIASTVAGQLWTQINPEAAFLYGAVFAVLGVVALLLLV